ncbi:hypothetical protein [Paraburkholderia sp. CI3]|uniref:hypothetical protein n=1 Tax=Paraburkholderia sp. CI3 TaxID=2991060 RepID=UPI003D1C0A56
MATERDLRSNGFSLHGSLAATGGGQVNHTLGLSSQAQNLVSFTLETEARGGWRVREVYDEDGINFRASARDHEFGSAKDLIKGVEQELDAWIAAWERQFMDEPDPAERTRLARAKLERDLRSIQKFEREQHYFLLRYRLRQSAARRLDGIAQQRAFLLATGDPQGELKSLEAYKARVLRNPKSWMAADVKVAELVEINSNWGFLLNALPRSSAQAATSERDVFAYLSNPQILDLEDAALEENEKREQRDRASARRSRHPAPA